MSIVKRGTTTGGAPPYRIQPGELDAHVRLYKDASGALYADITHIPVHPTQGMKNGKDGRKTPAGIIHLAEYVQWNSEYKREQGGQVREIRDETSGRPEDVGGTLMLKLALFGYLPGYGPNAQDPDPDTFEAPFPERLAASKEPLKKPKPQGTIEPDKAYTLAELEALGVIQ